MKRSTSPLPVYRWHAKRGAIRAALVVVATHRGVSVVVRGHAVVEAAPGGVEAPHVLEIPVRSQKELAALERFCGRA